MIEINVIWKAIIYKIKLQGITNNYLRLYKNYLLLKYFKITSVFLYFI